MTGNDAYEPRRLANDREDATAVLAAAREALARQPDDAAALEQAGHALIRLARVEEAREAFERCLAIDADRGGAHCGLGVMLLRSERLPEAEAALRRAVATDPSTPRALANLCWVLRRLERIDEAIEIGRQAVALRADAEARHYLAFALLAGDQAAAAREVCDEALRVSPADTAALAYKTTALAAMGDREQGRYLADFQRLLWMAGIPGAAVAGGLARFNEALAESVRSFPRRPFDPSQTRDIMTVPPAPIRQLRAIIDKAIGAYQAGLSVDAAHPFLAARPAEWEMEGWGTVMTASDVMEHHFHQHGWLSGVYYAVVPEFVGSQASGSAGCIEFCRFMQMSEQPMESEFALVRPEPGLLVLFPSYFYHRIVPFTGGERISIAFNVVPRE